MSLNRSTTDTTPATDLKKSSQLEELSALQQKVIPAFKQKHIDRYKQTEQFRSAEAKIALYAPLVSGRSMSERLLQVKIQELELLAKNIKELFDATGSAEHKAGASYDSDDESDLEKMRLPKPDTTDLEKVCTRRLTVLHAIEAIKKNDEIETLTKLWQTSLNQYLTDSSALQKEITAYAQQRATKDAEIERLELKQDVQALTRENSYLKEELTTLRASKSQPAPQPTVTEREFVQLQKQVEGLQRELSSLQKEMVAVKAKQSQPVLVEAPVEKKQRSGAWWG